LLASAFGVRSVCNHLPDVPTHFFRLGGRRRVRHSSDVVLRLIG